MLLTITTTHEHATDLGYLLHKNPGHPQSYDLPFGRAHVFYPVVEQARCEAALMLDIDPIRLVRGPGAVLTDYVNDRPYVSSSFMSVALARVLGTALGGRSKERPELAASPIPLRVRIAAVPCRGGASLVEQLFKPLGYEVAVENNGAEGAAGRYHNIELRAEDKTLGAVLTHVYVLLPVLDNQKHYWIGEAELKKLLDRGKGWLEEHSSRDLIVQRYLGHRRSLTTEARAVLEEARGSADGDGDESAQEADAETSGRRRRSTRTCTRSASSGWSSSCRRPGPPGWSTSAAGKAACSRACSTRPSSPKSWGPTPRRARSSSPAGGCACGGCRKSGGSASAWSSPG